MNFHFCFKGGEFGRQRLLSKYLKYCTELKYLSSSGFRFYDFRRLSNIKEFKESDSYITFYKKLNKLKTNRKLELSFHRLLKILLIPAKCFIKDASTKNLKIN